MDVLTFGENFEKKEKEMFLRALEDEYPGDVDWLKNSNFELSKINDVFLFTMDNAGKFFLRIRPPKVAGAGWMAEIYAMRQLVGFAVNDYVWQAVDDAEDMFRQDVDIFLEELGSLLC